METIVLDIYGFLLWSTFVLICGMGMGLGAYAVFCEFFRQAGYKSADHAANQAKADELFAPISVRAGK